MIDIYYIVNAYASRLVEVIYVPLFYHNLWGYFLCMILCLTTVQVPWKVCICFFQAIKIRETSSKLNVNPQDQSPDIMSLPSPVSEKTNWMQENFGASPAICDDSPTSETIHGGQIMVADPVSDTVNCYRASAREKKPNLF